MDDELKELIASLAAQGMDDDAIVAELQQRGYDVTPAGGAQTGAAPARPRPDSLLGGAAMQRPDASRAVAPPARKYPPQKMTDLSGASRTLADGLLLGWGGEAEALGRKVFQGRDYATSLREADEDVAGYAESNPGAALALQLGGGVVSGGMAGRGVVGAMRAMGREAGEAATRSAARKVATGVGAGVASGAVAGAGASPGNRMAGAVTGGIIGGVLPAVASPIVKGAKAVGRALPGTQRIGAGDEANVRILRAILNDDTVPVEIREKAISLAAQGAKPEMLIDLAGPNVKGLAEIIAQTPGKGSATITKALTDRQRGAVGRISDDIGRIGDEALDVDGVPIPLTDVARGATEEFADLYKLAYRKGNVLSKAELAPYMERPSSQEAWKRALRTMKDMGMKPRPLFGRDGKMLRTMNVKEFDLWKRALDETLEDPTLIERGGLGRSDIVNVQQNIRRPAIDIVDEAVPEYKVAREKAGDFIRAESAGKRASGAQRGQKSFMQDDPGELAGDFRDFADPEKALYRTGAVRDMRGTLNNQRSEEFGSMQDYAARLFGSPNQRAKVRTISEQGDAVIDLAERESNMFSTTKDILGGSPTARRIAQMADQNDVDLLGVAGELASGGGAGLFRRGWNTLNRRAAGLTPRTQDIMAERLTLPNVGDVGGKTPLVNYLDDLEQWRGGFNRNYYRGRGRVGGASSVFAGAGAGERP